MEELWPYDGDASTWPPKEEPPNIDEQAKVNRIFAYQRVRTPSECKLLLVEKRPPTVALEITRSWFKSNNGEIPMPRTRDEIIGGHCVLLVGYDDEKGSFIFRNSWGKNWGDQGYGYLPYEYFDNYLEEAWFQFEDGLHHSTLQGIQELNWGIHTPLHDVLHGVEVWNSASDDRLAWAFALNYDGFLNVEELFVMPQHRSKGYGKTLFKSLDKLSNSLSLPLRIWVSHADSRDDNLRVVNHIAQGYRLLAAPSPSRWASYILERKDAQTLDRVPQRPQIGFTTPSNLMMTFPFPDISKPRL